MLKYIFFYFIVSCSAYGDAGIIHVRPYNRVFSSGNLNLLMLVEDKDLTSKIENELKNIILGDRPAEGEKRIYSTKAIAEAIRMSPIKKNWNLQIPYQVVVENKGFEVDRETVEKQLKLNWQSRCEECQIQIQNIQMPNISKDKLKGPWDLVIDPNLPRGNFSARLVINSPVSTNLNYWVNGKVSFTKKVPVLTRSIPMGTRITDEDFKMDWRDITAATDSNPSANEMIGQRAKYTMNANDIIWSGSLVREKAVQRGDMVKVIIDEDNWQLSTQVQTQDDGYIGDVINLKNIQTNKIITGKIVGVGQVEIR